MVQSPEYPDLLWMPARSITAGRKPGKPIHITVHETDNPTSTARGEATWMQNRTDGTSAHYIVDEVEIIQGVRTTDTAHTAMFHGNRDGIHYEFCGVSGRADTADAQLRLAAKQMARDMRKHDIPLRRLTVSETRAGVPGINSHGDVTKAWPEDGGTHTDPGPNFPWDALFQYVKAELEGDDMPTAKEIAEAVWSHQIASRHLDNSTPHSAHEIVINAIQTSRAVKVIAELQGVQYAALMEQVDQAEEFAAAESDPDAFAEAVVARIGPAQQAALMAALQRIHITVAE